MGDNKNPARRKTASELRSARWLAPDDLRTFGHLSRLMQMGYAKRRVGRAPGHRDTQHLVRRSALPFALQIAH